MGFYLNAMQNTIQELYRLFLKHPLICIDSRKVLKNSIFFGLKGENFNGNEFAEEAIKKGAAYSVIDDENFKKNECCILVANTLESLQELSRYHRKNLNIPLIAITGTNGKTTTKELVNSILSKKFKTKSTSGNLNNHIGVPLTILSAQKDTELLVIEMGANHIGEIEKLCKIADPTLGIITNIGKAHLEGFGSEEGIIKAKSELYKHIESTKGTACVNINNPLLVKLSETLNRILYGDDPKADVIGKILGVDPFVKLSWSYKNPKNTKTDKEYFIKSKLIGAYNFENILAAITVGCYFNIEPEKINTAIEEFSPHNNRSQIIKKDNKTIILDAYNANPTNMEVAITNFKNMAGDKKIAIIGDMLELGEYSEKEHIKILQLLGEQNFYQVLLVGPIFYRTSEKKEYQRFENTEAAYIWLKNHPLPKSVILIKASRGMKLEFLADIL